MREIKFRAWNGYKMINLHVVTKLALHPEIQTDGIFIPFVDEYPIMQYTERKDSSGVEIYEKDIVKFTYWWFDGNVAESELTGVVVYLPDFMSYGLRGVKNKEWLRHVGGDMASGTSDTAPFATWFFDEADFRVIGNIYENPELREG